MSKRISYQSIWEQDFSWLKEGKIPGHASCVLCKKDNIYFGSMGRSALTSHKNSKKHQELERRSKHVVPLKKFFSQTQASTEKSSERVISSTSSSSSLTSSVPICISSPTPSASSPCTSSLTSPASCTSSASCSSSLTSSAPNLSSQEKWWLIKEDVTKAEILWCIQTVMTHMSLRNAESCVVLFKSMFSDSKVASDMKLGKDKTSYSIVHGLAPFFRKNLLDVIKLSDFFVVGFDESLNKFSQTQQMDLVVRFWNKNTSMVSSRYLSSVFLTKSTSTDLLEAIKEGLAGLNWKKILQVSMDGPNVNLKLLRLLKKEIEDDADSGHQLLDIGSCGLHILNVAFKAAFQKTGWKLIELFRACYYLFKDSPSRRGTYIQITKSTTFPLKFCSVRWLENSAVAKRVLYIFENLKIYVNHVKNDKTQKLTQSSKSFKTVEQVLGDNLLQAKLSFFASLAEEMETFLRQFQSDAPMAPFIYQDMFNLLKCCMERIVKEDVFKSNPIMTIDVNKVENMKSAKEVDIGYAARGALRKCKNVKDLDILHFRQECKVSLTSLVGKLIEKCPLNYPLTKSLSFLNPSELSVENAKEVCKNMSGAMEKLEESNLISASCAQRADREFKVLVDSKTILESCKNYSREVRLDVFWMEVLDNKKFENLQKVIQILLPLSHGNAMLERGFSINGDIIIENLKEESLIAQRMVFDSVSDCGGLKNLMVTKELILSMRNAHQRWVETLKAKKEKQNAESKAVAEKRKLKALTNELEEKKKKLMTDTAKDVAAIEEQIKNLKKNI